VIFVVSRFVDAPFGLWALLAVPLTGLWWYFGNFKVTTR
jgi:hypothetical protein